MNIFRTDDLKNKNCQLLPASLVDSRNMRTQPETQLKVNAVFVSHCDHLLAIFVPFHLTGAETIHFSGKRYFVLSGDVIRHLPGPLTSVDLKNI